MDMSKGKSLDFGFNEGGQGGGSGTSFEDLGYSPFSETETYAAGDVVIYDGGLKKFTTAHEGAWDDDDAEPTSVAAVIEAKQAVWGGITGTILNQTDLAGQLENMQTLINGKANKIDRKIETELTSSVELIPNSLIVLQNLDTTLAVTLATPIDDTIVNEYMLEFSTGATPPSVSFPAAVKWAVDLQIEANKTYQVSIVNNIAVFVAVQNS